MRKKKSEIHISSLLLNVAMKLSVLFTLGTLIILIGYILVKGVPHLSLDLFQWEYTVENQSMMPVIINTIIMTALTLAIALPFGIGAAVYMVEYVNQENKMVKIIRMTAETLAGIPSIVYGLFGFLMFSIALGWNYSLLSGAMTMAIMILPLIMRTTEEALLGVPNSYRQASFGLGVGKIRTIFKIVLPAAAPGILAGVILSIGRIVGETAALLFTAGTNPEIPNSVMDSTRTLSVHMYALLNEGLHQEAAYATAVVLMVLVIVINSISSLVAKKLSAGN